MSSDRMGNNSNPSCLTMASGKGSAGWIKIHRKLLDNPIVTKDVDHLALWILILLRAAHAPTDVLFRGKRLTLKPGQFTTGRLELGRKLKINRSKVDRILKTFESEQQIEQQSSNKCRLITVKNWKHYQEIERQNEQQVSNNRATSEQQVSTKEEYKNEKNEKKGTVLAQKKLRPYLEGDPAWQDPDDPSHWRVKRYDGEWVEYIGSIKKNLVWK